MLRTEWKRFFLVEEMGILSFIYIIYLYLSISLYIKNIFSVLGSNRDRIKSHRNLFTIRSCGMVSH